MRATTLLNRLLGLSGVVVDPRSWQVEPGGGEICVRVRLTRRLSVCPECSYATAHRYDTRKVDSSWRHRDVGGRVCRIRVRRRRLRCPEHGVLAEGCRLRGRDRGSRVMSSGWWRGWSREPTRRRSVRSLGLGGARSGRSVSGCRGMCWILIGCRGWLMSGWMRSRGGSATII